MKKIYYIALAVSMLLCSCVKDIDTDNVISTKPVVSDDNTKTVPMTIGCDINDSKTKVIVAGTDFTWVKGDAIGVLFIDAAGNVTQQCFYANEIESDPHYATFSGEAPVGNWVKISAYYPYNGSSKFTSSKLHFSAGGTPTINDLGDRTLMVAAPIDGPFTIDAPETVPDIYFGFHHLMGKLDFTIDYSKVNNRPDTMVGRKITLIIKTLNADKTQYIDMGLGCRIDLADESAEAEITNRSNHLTTLVGYVGADGFPTTASIMAIPQALTNCWLNISVMIDGVVLFVENKDLTARTDANPYLIQAGHRNRINVAYDPDNNLSSIYQPNEDGTFGNGTLENPFVIDCENALEKVNKALTSGTQQGIHYIQTEDITLTKEWDATANTFEGNYDGGNHFIEVGSMGVTSKTSSLFYDLGDAVINNVEIRALDVVNLHKQADYAGLLAATVSGGATITNCVANGDFSGDLTGGKNTVGGLIGMIETDSRVFISRCAFDGNIDLTAKNANLTAGGIVGNVDGANVIICDSYSKGTITGPESKSKNASTVLGGIAAINSGSIVNCYSAMDITVLKPNSTLGGIAGDNLGNLANCYSNSVLTTLSSSNIGTLAGSNTADIEYCCYTSGTPVGTGSDAGCELVTDAVVMLDKLNSKVIALENEYSIKRLSWWVNTGDNNGFPVLVENREPGSLK